MSSIEEGFAHAVKNQRLIHGVLKQIHVYPTRFDYEDYFQEAVIIYAQTYAKFMTEHNDADKFKVYIFQRLRWRMTDLLRQEMKYSEVHSLDEFDFSTICQETNDLLENLNLGTLTAFENQIFQEHFINNKSLLILARRYECSTRNLRYHRNRLLVKLRASITL
ncbi:sigma-70 family RNA polymerase sigma factor [Companilactobacillus jidongensis]|uniref:sigma-70 family RNA polymerase sigma factor n=1 Tax=Companilactobacillus jidongensis TaxID=2486006 RepID=UPI0013DD9D6C|nr:sigma-70 family RNA polymerase sigma factor [Companilactobacillus jidongensis]